MLGNNLPGARSYAENLSRPECSPIHAIIPRAGLNSSSTYFWVNLMPLTLMQNGVAAQASSSLNVIRYGCRR
ncbi:hypothetical protein ACS33_03265 [Edwardsiella ictaluri]|nr:hypothetical protein ABY58_02655 [Edwardsiella ictaluri]KOO56074.1 hypothetical protein ACS33_03265 [Edwardsiella ictaluri]BEH98409.1 hypothetical protein KH20906_11370 [Edwardsiella ictaluri]BEI01908.1 hypothetical protein KB20921_11690 [Edwardsiella ictaluri]BEI05376.1 hypothetical protein KH201010_11620 [Edwardsiella ictaluri]